MQLASIEDLRQGREPRDPEVMLWFSKAVNAHLWRKHAIGAEEPPDWIEAPPQKQYVTKIYEKQATTYEPAPYWYWCLLHDLSRSFRKSLSKDARSILASLDAFIKALDREQRAREKRRYVIETQVQDLPL